MDNSRPAIVLRVFYVLLPLHAAAVVLLVTSLIAITQGPQVDANIGAGFLYFLLLPLGAPWSFAYELFGGRDGRTDALVMAAAVFNLLVHVVFVCVLRAAVRSEATCATQ